MAIVKDNFIFVFSKVNNQKVHVHPLPYNSIATHEVTMQFSKEKLIVLQTYTILTKRSRHINKSVELKTFLFPSGKVSKFLRIFFF